MPKSTLAALDLGSNSFHLVIAQVIDGQIMVIDKLKERVQLAAGLDEAGRLSEEAQLRALNCLRRFGQRLAEFQTDRVRVVGTNTLRKAVNAQTFRDQAALALGHPIAVISGQEEARLVYKGVTHGIEDQHAQRLVVDIGGGSTECIIGRGDEQIRADSLFMGCVSFTRRFFGDGQITKARIDEAVVSARLEFGPINRFYKTAGWDRVYGSSGTIVAIQRLIHASGWEEHTITPEALNKVEALMLKAGSCAKLAHLPNLKSERAAVLPGGFAILRAVMESLKIKRMEASKRALREGVLFDMLGQSAVDVRNRAVRALCDRYQVDQEQAQRVEEQALKLADALVKPWGIEKAPWRRRLRWAASMHEIGMGISHAGHHKHGAYIVRNVSLLGFAQGEQCRLAAMILCHRRRIDNSRLDELVGRRKEQVLRDAVPLRLAVALNRTRSPKPRPEIGVSSTDDHSLHLTFPSMYLAERPLTRADLESEARYLEAAGIKLTWN